MHRPWLARTLQPKFIWVESAGFYPKDTVRLYKIGVRGAGVTTWLSKDGKSKNRSLKGLNGSLCEPCGSCWGNLVIVVRGAKTSPFELILDTSVEVCTRSFKTRVRFPPSPP